jgi:SAM-dependent methyltransferase
LDLTELPAESSFERHPWEIERARFFTGVLAPLVRERTAELLDAGAGDGWFAARLVDQHPRLAVTCFDPGYEDRPPPAWADRGGIGPAAQTDRLTFVSTLPDGPFDVVTLLDVLEHVPDDATFLARLGATLRPRGHLLISVPAWPVLFSSHDLALAHQRRYLPRRLTGLLEREGFTVTRSGGLFHSLLVARGLAVAAERVRSRSNSRGGAEHELRWRGGARSARLLGSALRADARVSKLAAARGVQLPGLSWWALCQTRS